MKRLLIAATALALSAVSAFAGSRHVDPSKPIIVYRGQAWTVYAMQSNDGSTPLCGMQIDGKDRSMYVKYLHNINELMIQLYKSTWRFPKNGVDVPLVVTFDNEDMIEATAIGKMGDGGFASVHFFLKEKTAEDFMEVFSSAKAMGVRFGEGNENTWTADMRGSRAAANAFHVCINMMRKHFERPTQPYSDDTPNADASQPYNTNPKKSVKDDGGI